MKPADELAMRSHAFRKTCKPLEDRLLSTIEVGLWRRQQFKRHRQSDSHQAAFEKPDPLVSILIATYNRAALLRDRSVRSALSQTYTNLEIIVVGDCCTDETERLMGEIADPRLRFVNLPERGRYPTDPRLRWMVAGTTPVNHALALARGDFVTHLDDDDEHAPDRVERLIAHARRNRVDLIYHPFRFETAVDHWEVNDASSFRWGQATTSSIFYHSCFKSIPWDINAYRWREPGDWNRLRKIQFLGARIERNPGILLNHFVERNQATP